MFHQSKKPKEIKQPDVSFILASFRLIEQAYTEEHGSQTSCGGDYSVGSRLRLTLVLLSRDDFVSLLHVFDELGQPVEFFLWSASFRPGFITLLKKLNRRLDVRREAVGNSQSLILQAKLLDLSLALLNFLLDNLQLTFQNHFRRLLLFLVRLSVFVGLLCFLVSDLALHWYFFPQIIEVSVIYSCVMALITYGVVRQALTPRRAECSATITQLCRAHEER